MFKFLRFPMIANSYMKAFAEAWPDESILQAPLAKLTWYHNLTLLEKVKSPRRGSGMQSRPYRTAGAETSLSSRSRAASIGDREGGNELPRNAPETTV
jgi:hypothetical protein